MVLASLAAVVALAVEPDVSHWRLSEDDRRLELLTAPAASPGLGLQRLTLDCRKPGALRVEAPGIEYVAPGASPPIRTPLVLEFASAGARPEMFQAPVLSWRVRADARSPQTAVFAPSYKYRRLGDMTSVTARFGQETFTAPLPEQGLWRRFVSRCAAV